MGNKKYVVESEFDDLHGNPAETPDLEFDLSDENNPIIQAAVNGEDDWQPPEDDDEELDDKEDDEDDEEVDDDTDDDELDDDDDDEAEEEDDEDDDDERYSKKVQKRIDRERDLRRRDKEEADRRIRKLERRQELREAQDDFSKAEREATQKLQDLRNRKVEALEEGETEKVVDIDDKILDIKADMKAKQIELKQVEKDIDNDDDDTTSGTPEAGRKFLAKYPEFHTNNQFKNVLLLTDKSVAARGFDKNTQEYYDEIERVMKPQFPNIIKKTVRVTTKKRKLQKKRSAVGKTTKAGTRHTTTNRNRRGRIRLTKADQQQMEIFGMDPTNPADAKAWAQGKGS